MQIIGLAVVAVLALVAFGFAERRAAEPVLALGLFRIRNFTLVSAIGFIVGFALFGAVTFLPLYQQTVQGASATNSGLLLLPMMAGMLVTSIAVGRAITKTGRYKAFPVIGGTLMAVGMFLLSLLGVHTTRTTSSIYMVVLGIGMGFLMQTTMLIAQNSVEQRDLGVASSAATFFRSIGGSFGVSLFGAVFAHRLTADVSAHLGKSVAARLSGGGGGRLDPALMKAMPAPVRDGFLREIKSTLILQPGPAALTDGLDALETIISEWASRPAARVA